MITPYSLREIVPVLVVWKRRSEDSWRCHAFRQAFVRQSTV